LISFKFVEMSWTKRLYNHDGNVPCSYCVRAIMHIYLAGVAYGLKIFLIWIFNYSSVIIAFILSLSLDLVLVFLIN
jgi:hypothetical protein